MSRRELDPRVVRERLSALGDDLRPDPEAWTRITDGVAARRRRWHVAFAAGAVATAVSAAAVVAVVVVPDDAPTGVATGGPTATLAPSPTPTATTGTSPAPSGSPTPASTTGGPAPEPTRVPVPPAGEVVLAEGDWAGSWAVDVPDTFVADYDRGVAIISTADGSVVRQVYRVPEAACGTWTTRLDGTRVHVQPVANGSAEQCTAQPVVVDVETGSTEPAAEQEYRATAFADGVVVAVEAHDSGSVITWPDGATTTMPPGFYASHVSLSGDASLLALQYVGTAPDVPVSEGVAVLPVGAAWDEASVLAPPDGCALQAPGWVTDPTVVGDHGGDLLGVVRVCGDAGAVEEARLQLVDVTRAETVWTGRPLPMASQFGVEVRWSPSGMALVLPQDPDVFGDYYRVVGDVVTPLDTTHTADGTGCHFADADQRCAYALFVP